MQYNMTIYDLSVQMYCVLHSYNTTPPLLEFLLNYVLILLYVVHYCGL